MKITVNQLRRIIKEEVEKTINEIRDVPRSTSFKLGDVIVLNQDYGLVKAISGNETSAKSFPAGTRFMVTQASPDDEPGGVTFTIQQMTDIDPKVSRQRGVPGGSLSRGSYWIFPEEEGLFTKST